MRKQYQEWKVRHHVLIEFFFSRHGRMCPDMFFFCCVARQGQVIMCLDRSTSLSEFEIL